MDHCTKQEQKVDGVRVYLLNMMCVVSFVKPYHTLPPPVLKRPFIFSTFFKSIRDGTLIYIYIYMYNILYIYMYAIKY